MIRFGVVLATVLVALGLLVGGILTTTESLSLLLVYLSIGVAAVAAVLLAVVVIMMRHDLFGRSQESPSESGPAGEPGGPSPSGMASTPSGMASSSGAVASRGAAGSSRRTRHRAGEAARAGEADLSGEAARYTVAAAGATAFRRHDDRWQRPQDRSAGQAARDHTATTDAATGVTAGRARAERRPPGRTAPGPAGAGAAGAGAAPPGQAADTAPAASTGAARPPGAPLRGAGSAGDRPAAATLGAVPAADRPAVPPQQIAGTSEDAIPAAGPARGQSAGASLRGAGSSGDRPAAATLQGAVPAADRPASARPPVAGAGEEAGADDGAADRDPSSDDRMSAQVTVVPGITRYHRAECILIRFLGPDDLELMTRRAAEDAGCAPCKACQPDKSG